MICLIFNLNILPISSLCKTFVRSQGFIINDSVLSWMETFMRLHSLNCVHSVFTSSPLGLSYFGILSCSCFICSFEICFRHSYITFLPHMSAFVIIEVVSSSMEEFLISDFVTSLEANIWLAMLVLTTFCHFLNVILIYHILESSNSFVSFEI